MYVCVLKDLKSLVVMNGYIILQVSLWFYLMVLLVVTQDWFFRRCRKGSRTDSKSLRRRTDL